VASCRASSSALLSIVMAPFKAIVSKRQCRRRGKRKGKMAGRAKWRVFGTFRPAPPRPRPPGGGPWLPARRPWALARGPSARRHCAPASMGRHRCEVRVVSRHRDVVRHHRYADHGYLHEAAGPGATLHPIGWGRSLARRMRSLTPRTSSVAKCTRSVGTCTSPPSRAPSSAGVDWEARLEDVRRPRRGADRSANADRSCRLILRPA
jgi:hypothetical protein